MDRPDIVGHHLLGAQDGFIGQPDDEFEFEAEIAVELLRAVLKLDAPADGVMSATSRSISGRQIFATG